MSIVPLHLIFFFSLLRTACYLEVIKPVSCTESPISRCSEMERKSLLSFNITCLLRLVNLSMNHLCERIPEKLENLNMLQSLDLSLNELYGPIPQSLSSLNFLSYLNLSFNNFSWKISNGNQLKTLDDPSIYEGNSLL
jgi:hypothetical protein